MNFNQLRVSPSEKGDSNYSDNEWTITNLELIS